jgi:hypothetical protein
MPGTLGRMPAPVPDEGMESDFGSVETQPARLASTTPIAAIRFIAFSPEDDKATR